MNQNKQKLTWDGVEEYLATHVIQQAKNDARRWFIAFVVTLAALVGTNGAWIYVFQSYDYVSQDGNGVNNINSGSQGDVSNGPESQN